MQRRTKPPPPSLLFATTTLLGALLLFQVQPLIARLILPWFGGSAGVWTACLLFFQVALLAGYGYAHWLQARPGRMPALVHVGLLAASLASLPILPSASFKPASSADPLLDILALLAATIGLPYFLLAATSPLLQAWYTRTRGGALPYRFFALSNLGSMLGLLSYPVLVEPHLANRQQAWIWSLSYALFALLCAMLALRSSSAGTAIDATAPVKPPPRPPSSGQGALWIALAATASALLLSVTSHLTQNVAPIPLLWVAPLGAYLLSFILCFDSDRWYRRRLFLPLGIVALPGMAWLTTTAGSIGNLELAVTLLCTGLFVLCMICHGELSVRRPEPTHLTYFYLMIAAGGALGGLAIGVVAPYTLNALYDLPATIALCAWLFVGLLWRARGGGLRTASPAALPVLGTLLAVAMTALLVHDNYRRDAHARLLSRSFYGALAVYELTPGTGSRGPVRSLRHGTIEHGVQFLRPEHASLATTYYTGDSGIGLTIRALQAQASLNVGIIGLGAGTLATYARPGDHYSFYEINPDVIRIAQTQFSFLDKCAARCEIHAGDARLRLESETSRQFDLLAVDAFSGDSIPVHLLTREAFTLYWKHVKPDGVLAVHVSNRYLWLAPIVAKAAAEGAKASALVATETADPDRQASQSDWVLATARPGFFQQSPLVEAIGYVAPIPGMRMWTDDYSNLFQLLRR